MKALRLLLAAVLAFIAGAGLGIAYDASPAHADSSVTASNASDAYAACYLAYGLGAAVPDIPTYIDCVNAATAYFYGRGHHSRFFNA
jgi:hypothetical protein